MSDASAVLALEDGTLFYGQGIGRQAETVGEVVFNTSMSGYQEILTDPSYAQQIITFTYPHIGNVGINEQDHEAQNLWSGGFIIREESMVPSSWRHQQSLGDWALSNNLTGISGIDTRALTRILREKGAMKGCIQFMPELDSKQAISAASAFGGLKGVDLAKVVTTKQAYEWAEPSIDWLTQDIPEVKLTHHVVVMDFGVKTNILRMLVDRGCRLTVVPATTSYEEIAALNPAGVMLSNGPGDPEPCAYAIETISQLIAAKTPLFGICLGYQLLALACGATTAKMKFGHHGANHPVQSLANKRVMITSQNHGFAVDATTLPSNVEVTHISLFDQSLQGIRLTDAPAYGFQGHPEASPGPHDVSGLFDEFIQLMS